MSPNESHNPEVVALGERLGYLLEGNGAAGRIYMALDNCSEPLSLWDLMFLTGLKHDTVKYYALSKLCHFQLVEELGSKDEPLYRLKRQPHRDLSIHFTEHDRRR